MTPQNREKIRAAKAEWRSRNKDKIAAYKADYNARNREQVLAQKRDAERRRQEREKAQKKQRAAAVQRAKKWAAANPEKVTQSKQEWTTANPEKVKAAKAAWAKRNRETQRERATVWRDANPEKIAQYTKDRVRNRDNNPAHAKVRADPEAYARNLQVNRDRRRLHRQLTNAGLPQPQLRKTSAAEQRANGAAAREFFTRVRTATERRELIRKEDGPPTTQELLDAAQVRADVRHRAEIQQRLDRYIKRHGARLHREVELDSRALELRGAQPLDIHTEVQRRARLFANYDQPLRPADIATSSTRSTQNTRMTPRTQSRDADRTR